MTDSTTLDRIIDAHVYLFHRDVRGQEDMERVVRQDYPALANAILRRITERGTN